MAQKKLTPKQTQVKHLAEGGLSPTQIAKRLKVTPSAVHGHLRRIKEAGYEIPAAGNGAAEKPASLPQTTPVAGLTHAGGDAPAEPVGGNGFSEFDVEGTIRGALEQNRQRDDEIENEISNLQGQLATLEQERSEISRQSERYEAALSAALGA